MPGHGPRRERLGRRRHGPPRRRPRPPAAACAYTRLLTGSATSNVPPLDARHVPPADEVLDLLRQREAGPSVGCGSVTGSPIIIPNEFVLRVAAYSATLATGPVKHRRARREQPQRRRLAGLGERHERRPDEAGADEPGLRQHPLGGRRVGLREDHVGHRVQREVQVARLVELARRPSARTSAATAAGARLAVAETNPTPPSDSSGRHSSSIPDQISVSRPGDVQHPGEVLEVLRGLLDPDDVGVRLPQPGDGLRRDVDRGPRRHVVGDQRQVGELAARPCRTSWNRPSWVGRA